MNRLIKIIKSLFSPQIVEKDGEFYVRKLGPLGYDYLDNSYMRRSYDYWWSDGNCVKRNCPFLSIEEAEKSTNI